MKYLLACFIALFVISACTPNNSINNVETFPKIGDKIPNISWTTINGEKIDLNQFKGSWVLLCYWCSCPVHRNDILTIHNVYDSLYDKNLDVIVINDTYAQIELEAFGKQNNVPFYLIEDNQKTIDKLVPFGNRPIYLLIDGSGDLHAIEIGTFRSGENSVNNVINFLDDVIKVRIDNITVTNITSNRATVRWKTDKAVPCWLEIHPQGDPIGKCIGKTNPNTFHELILNCNPNTAYTFNVAASGLDNSLINDASNRSSEFSFQTLPNWVTSLYEVDSTKPKISNVKVSIITDTSAELYWETDVEAQVTATICKYISSTDAPLNSQKIDFIEDIYFTKKHSFTISSLEPRRLYDVGLNAKDRMGRVADYSVEFLTQPSNYTHGAKISNISLYDITDRSAKLKWSTDKSVWSSACYKYECSSGDINTEHSYTLSYGLEPDTEYWVQILAHGESVSDVFNFRTLKTTDKVDMK
ncbi:MAG: redoxin domain-containing protein [Dehalococcoidia bacterium]|jgi:peroxiredoxin